MSWLLKTTKPLIFEAVQKHFHDAHVEDSTTVAIREHETVEKGHGRLEKRHYFQCPIPKELRPLFAQWRGARSIGQAINIIQRDGKETSEVRYFISSLDVGVKKFAAAVRGHWSIENKLHWTLDVTFNEDQSRIRRTMEPKILHCSGGTCSALSSSTLRRTVCAESEKWPAGAKTIS